MSQKNIIRRDRLKNIHEVYYTLLIAYTLQIFEIIFFQNITRGKRQHHFHWEASSHVED